MNELDVLVTVIIPIYNVKDYLERCIISVIEQTYRNLEIILVDDGSNDGSEVICDTYCNLDTRIKVIHQNNMGLSSARNAGLKILMGEYVTFLDSDDWLEKDFVKRMVEKAIEFDSDLVVSRLIKSNLDTKGRLIDRYPTDYPFKVINNKIDAINTLLYRRLFSNSACGKLFKSNIFDNIEFPVGKLYEDFAVLYKIIAILPRVVVDDYCGYHYFVRIGSILNSDFCDKDFVFLELANEQKHFIINTFPECYKAVYTRFLDANLEMAEKILNSTKCSFNNTLNSLQKNIHKNFKIVLFDIKAPCYLKIRLLIFIINIDLYRYFMQLRKLLKLLFGLI